MLVSLDLQLYCLGLFGQKMAFNYLPCLLAHHSLQFESEDATSLKRKNYDMHFKLEVVAYSENTINQGLQKTRRFLVHASKIRPKQKAQLEAQLKASLSCFISSSKRLQGAGRSLKDKDFDERLINWVREQRQKKLHVNRTMIQKESLTLSIDENFKASNGWLEKFLLRHNLFSRRPTTTCQKETEEYAEKIVDYFLFVEQTRCTYNYTYIYGADERPSTWIT